MYYLVIGRDGADASERRQAQRQQHLDSVAILKKEGKVLYAVAMLSEGKMIGSVMVFNFADEAEMNDWRANEPYITGNVWESVEVMECAVPPAFLN